MTFLHLVAAGGETHRVAAVASFDHRTGLHSEKAANLVTSEATALGFPVVTARAAEPLDDKGTEAVWRRARWAFLRDVGIAHGATVATAHTRDDQIETVCLRILRGSGARGLAGLLADSDIARPIVRVSRDELARWAAAHDVPHVEDPSNLSRAHLRNRVRLDILPVLELAQPTIREWLADLGERAAVLRREVELFVHQLPHTVAKGELAISKPALHAYDAESLALIWTVLAAKVGATLDRRGTRRLSEFTNSEAGTTGAVMQLSGGFEIVRRRDSYLLRRTAPGAADAERSLAGEVHWGDWTFTTDSNTDLAPPDLWEARIPRGGQATLRQWRPGDRMQQANGRPARRVKRFLADAGIVGPERSGWPVVVVNDEVVWIPGIGRSDAATVRSGRPEQRYRCERSHR